MSDIPSNSNAPESVKKRQRRLFATVVAVVFLVAGLGIFLSENSGPKPRPPTPKPVVTNIAAPGSQFDPKEAWRIGADAQMKAMEQQNKDLLERMKRYEAGNAPEGGLTATPPTPVKADAAEPADNKVQSYIQSEKQRLMEASRQGEKRLPPPTSKTGASPENTTYPPGTPIGDSAPVEAPKVRGITILSFDDSKPQVITQSPGVSTVSAKEAGAPSQKGNNPRKTIDNYLPIGHMPIELLGGLDAPSGGQAQTNPLPVYLRVKDNGYLPNHFRSKVKDCTVIGTGYGDLSSERVIVRTETLSCIMDDGSVVEVSPLKGTIYGEDGKLGIHGRVVQKTGQLLANALTAGIASGIGQAFQQSSTTQSISPLGSTSTVESGKAFQAGIGTGAGKALDQLAQYYIRLADKTFPVVEVDAGRTGDLVTQQGTYIDFPPSAGSDSAGNDFTALDKRNRRMTRYEDY